MRSVGEEERMGAHMQKSLAVLKQVPEGHAFEDLTHQTMPLKAKIPTNLFVKLFRKLSKHHLAVSAMSQSQKHIKTFCSLSGLLQIHPLCRTAEL